MGTVVPDLKDVPCMVDLFMQSDRYLRTLIVDQPDADADGAMDRFG